MVLGSCYPKGFFPCLWIDDRFNRLLNQLAGIHQYCLASEQARWAESCTVTGYPNGQYGTILHAQLTVPAASHKNTLQCSNVPYDKTSTDQACLVKMAGYQLAFSVFMEFHSVSVHKHAKHELSLNPTILTTRLINNPYLTEKGWEWLTE